MPALIHQRSSFPTQENAGASARAIEQGFALLKRIASTLPDAVSQTAVVLGSPAEALASFCHQEQAELLVVGSRGRGALSGALLGSVSRALAASAPVPVLVVPPNARLAERAAARSDASQPSALCDGVAAAAMSVVALIDVDGQVDQAGRRC